MRLVNINRKQEEQVASFAQLERVLVNPVQLAKMIASTLMNVRIRQMTVNRLVLIMLGGLNVDVFLDLHSPLLIICASRNLLRG